MKALATQAAAASRRLGVALVCALCVLAGPLAGAQSAAVPAAPVPAPVLAPESDAGGTDWGQVIVTIQASRVHYNFYQPWFDTVRRTSKNGVVVEGRQILTTADWLQNSSLVRVQRNGRGAWWNARLQWVDYHANLAVLTVEDPRFWEGLRGAVLSEAIITEGEVQLRRRAKGQLEQWAGTIRRVAVRNAQRSFVRYMMLEATSSIDSSGWSEAVTRGGELVGLTSAQSQGDRMLIIPATLIRQVMAAKAADPAAGLSYLDFGHQSSKNPANTAYLGLDGDPRGVIVTKVPPTSAFAGQLHPRDIILEIDGFPIDQEGEYKDPDYGFLRFDNLATRGKLAGDPISFKVWREGAPTTFSVPLPKARYENELVPDQVYDRSPQYLIAGGLVFLPLTTDYLRSWGKEWWKRAPFRLRYYIHEPPSFERPHIVIMSRVLPDPINLGYHNLAYLAVDRINGHHIVDLGSVQKALEDPQNGFHVIDFLPNNSVQKLVLDAAELPGADQRILSKFGVPALSVIH